MVVLGLLAAALAGVPAGAAERYAPVLVHDRREASPLTDVTRATVGVPGLPAPGPPAAYARVAGRTVQYWLFYADNPHDRGILRTGRHEGDWELVQLTFGDDGRPRTILASQHAGAEACRFDAVRRDGTHPVVYVAHGSHAGYFRPGTRDRTFPDPNDEAPGNGVRVRPRVVRVSARDPAWMRWPGRWGATRAGIVPAESDSPRGPAFQGVRWEHPAAFEATARSCAAAAPARNYKEIALGMAVLGAGVLAAAAWSFRRRRRAGLE